jgi:hypothetical protein
MLVYINCLKLLTWLNRLTLKCFSLVIGKRQISGQPRIDNAGECTLHARTCGAGIGIFFLVLKDQVLLIHGSNAVTHMALYLDSNGEPADAQRGRNRPLFLSKSRFKRAEDIYLNNLIPYEVSRARASSDRYITAFYY